jgi:FdhD protein
MAPTSSPVRRSLWARTGAQDGERRIPEETPVALVHDASTTAVMMATPADLEDFAVGFSLTEGLVQDARQIRGLEIVETELGVEARVWLEPGCGAALMQRRRQIAGPTGCGLCGLDSLAEAVLPAPRVAQDLRFTAEDVHAALAALGPAQALGSATRGTHAAGWWTRAQGLVAIREDVGRHNALDKLVGALARDGETPAGLLLLTSRVSVEMVQKASVLGAQAMIAVSVPTALAVRVAEAAGVTLIAVARSDGFEVFTHPHRLAESPRGGTGDRHGLRPRPSCRR